MTGLNSSSVPAPPPLVGMGTHSGSSSLPVTGPAGELERKPESKSHGGPPLHSAGTPTAPSVPTSRKSESKLKNYGSWSSLAQSAASSPGGALKTSNVKDSFQQFKKQAKEKMDKQRQLFEAQEQRRQQREMAEKERLLRQEHDKRRDEEEPHHQGRKGSTTPASLPSGQPHLSLVDSPSAGPPAHQDVSAGSNASSPAVSERERQRLREQERRRREAMAVQIDMNRQSDIMATFEEML